MYLTRLKALREARDAITERTATGSLVIERITLAGPEIVDVRITAAAWAGRIWPSRCR